MKGSQLSEEPLRPLPCGPIFLKYGYLLLQSQIENLLLQEGPSPLAKAFTWLGQAHPVSIPPFQLIWGPDYICKTPYLSHITYQGQDIYFSHRFCLLSRRRHDIKCIWQDVRIFGAFIEFCTPHLLCARIQWSISYESDLHKTHPYKGSGWVTNNYYSLRYVL